ncbi:cytochrome c oxidase accessory protein CcoG [Halomonas sp. GD1P12]|uniref:cytochrome c oxidase accessory protein CcoG n=1 Tax=Halomonas sp. GD1P12 TaxID=2982691 RepID=UPI0021E3E22C|nr:cytochrome c oxidase accessory protein CcoG [Halomonas sp. GD1P12]UYG00563.1 cytochrome c oxidase accessory protein CcoG [Halomonas sp. GD1P12]
MQPIPLQDVTPPPDTFGEAGVRLRGHLYVRESKGVFQALRRRLNVLLMGGFFLLPWINIQGRPALWLDIPGREFHLMSATFYPQEFILLALLFIAAAFGLFFVTRLLGRVWCGYTCPQSVWTFLFMWVEHRLEGSRHRRLRRDKKGPAVWAPRKLVKHALWALMALATGITIVGYFAPIRTLALDVVTLEAGGWALFWVGFFTFFTYLNAGWLREQVCLHMCPYARFQSVMVDRDTLTVAYDTARGEPRGGEPTSKGDCVDCHLCVQVCPTGIDIRDGLQYACIQCAACVDACDTVMTRLNRPTGLVGYTTQNRLEGRPAPRAWRYRAGALLLLALTLALLTWALTQRAPASLEAERARGTLYSVIEGGEVQNVYRLTVRNHDRQAHTYRLGIEALAGARLDTRAIEVPGGGSTSRVVSVSAPAGVSPSQPFSFVLASESGEPLARRPARFLSGERR